MDVEDSHMDMDVGVGVDVGVDVGAVEFHADVDAVNAVTSAVTIIVTMARHAKKESSINPTLHVAIQWRDLELQRLQNIGWDLGWDLGWGLGSEAMAHMGISE